MGESAVDSDYGITHAGQLFLDHDNKIPGLSRIADAIHRHGALASIELCHGGGQTMPGLIGDRPPIAPSPMTSQLHEALLGRKIDVQVMDGGLIEQVIENYAQAALRVEEGRLRHGPAARRPRLAPRSVHLAADQPAHR